MEQRAMIARLNIERYRSKLAVETDEALRRTMIGLLADEETKVAALKEPQKVERKNA